MKSRLEKQDSLLGQKVRMFKKLRLITLSVFALIAVFAFAGHSNGIGVLALAPIAIVAGGNIKKAEDMSQEEKDTLATIQKSMNDVLAEFSKNNQITPEQLQEKMDEMITGYKTKDSSGAFAKAFKEMTAMSEAFVGMATKLDNLEKNGGLDMNMKDGGELASILKETFGSEKFKDFQEGKTSKSSGKFSFVTKALSSLGNSYTGTINISTQSQRISENPQPRKVSMRDIIMTDQGDSNMPSITYRQITDLDRNAITVTENGALSESSFKMKEVTDQTTRIGTTLPISKRMLKAIPYLQTYLMNRLPLWVRMAEDFQILKGDGQGQNLNGIMNRCPNFKNVLGTLVTGVATSVLHVTSYAQGAKTLIEFTDAQPLIQNGMSITFAGFTNAAYNDKWTANKVNDRQIVIDCAYTAETDVNAAAATFTAGGEFAATVHDANIAEVIKAAQAYLTYGEYTPNAVALNPITIFMIDNLKDTQDRPLNYITIVNGVKTISGLAIVETTAVVKDEFVMGDWNLGASLVDFTAIEMEFAEDVTTKKTNEVVLIVQEEVIMPVYNPYSFLQGKLSECKTLINIA